MNKFIKKAADDTWMKIHVLGILPILFAFKIYQCILLFKILNDNTIGYTIISIVATVLLALAFVGMLRFTSWGYMINFFAIATTAVFAMNAWETGVVLFKQSYFILGILTVYTFIYFQKRRKMYVKETKAMVDIKAPDSSVESDI